MKERPARAFYGAVTVGERGQVVIPAEARKEQGISPADKLLVFAHPHSHGLLVVKASDLQSLVGDLQGLLDLVGATPGAEAEA